MTSDNNNNDKPNQKPNSTLTLGGGTLTLSGKSKPAAPKRQHGVQVEVVGVKRARRFNGPDGGRGGGLTDREHEVRLRALRASEEEAQRKAREKEKEEERLRIETEAKRVEAERLEAERVIAEAAAKIAAEEAAKHAAILGAQQPVAKAAAVKSGDAVTAVGAKGDAGEKKADFKLGANTQKALRILQREQDDEPEAVGRAPKTKAPPAAKKKGVKVSVKQALSDVDDDTDFDQAQLGADVPRRRVKRRALQAAAMRNRSKIKVFKEVVISGPITVADLAGKIAERATSVVRALMKMGMFASPSEKIDPETAELVAAEFGHKVVTVAHHDEETALFGRGSLDAQKAVVRPPVVTFMGHVDHGKTSLLDAIRKAKVAQGEAGGITQHIGAYQVKTDGGAITFLDTPGHEAFTEMRRRGANTTDIVVLVVAADDGIMKQTEEAINHAKAAGVPIVVAVNKVDKPSADPKKVRNMLLNYELVPEELGGDVMTVDVSAKTGFGLEKLLETILLQAEVLQLQADPTAPARATVIEARLDKARGAVATMLVTQGTLRVGDIIVSGSSMGRVRAMSDHEGRVRKEAGPSDPVEVLGLNEAPEAGAMVAVAESEKQARDVVQLREARFRETAGAAAVKSSLDNLLDRLKGHTLKELAVVIKADVQGSVEAIEQSLLKMNNSEVGVRVLHKGVGGITESDVTLAGASSALVLGFNVRADSVAKQVAERYKIDIQYYSIIYDLIEDIKNLLSGMLKPTVREQFLGYAQIREVFNITKAGKVAGSYVTEGNIKRGSHVRLLRDSTVIYQGKLRALRRFKDDVKEVSSGFECGMSFENYEDIRPGDVVEAFELIEEKRFL